MGLNFRKRIRVIPGFYLNLSKSGMSATVGMKGFNVNIGQKGSYLNTGIPGTGIYSRTRLDNKPPDIPNQKNNNISNFQAPIDNETVEIKSFQPELLTSDGLFGLKETIIKAQEIKKELKKEWDDVESELFTTQFLMVISYIFIFGFFIKLFRENYKKTKIIASEAKEAYENFKLDIDFNMDENLLIQYVLLKKHFKKLTKIDKIWDLTSETDIDSIRERTSAKKLIEREVVYFSMSSLDYINTKYEALKLQNANGGDLYIYPGFIIMPNKYSNDFAVIDFNDIEIKHKDICFLEDDFVPSDAKVVDRTWKYVNKNGKPDRRYNYNPEIPIVQYYELTLKSQKGLYESFQFSNLEAGVEFCILLEQYRNSLADMKWNKASSKIGASEHSEKSQGSVPFYFEFLAENDVDIQENKNKTFNLIDISTWQYASQTKYAEWKGNTILANGKEIAEWDFVEILIKIINEIKESISFKMIKEYGTEKIFTYFMDNIKSKKADDICKDIVDNIKSSGVAK